MLIRYDETTVGFRQKPYLKKKILNIKIQENVLAYDLCWKVIVRFYSFQGQRSSYDISYNAILNFRIDVDPRGLANDYVDTRGNMCWGLKQFVWCSEKFHLWVTKGFNPTNK